MSDTVLVPQGFADFAIEVMKRAGDIRSLKLSTGQLTAKLRVNALDAVDGVREEHNDVLTNLIEVAAIAMCLGVNDE